MGRKRSGERIPDRAGCPIQSRHHPRLDPLTSQRIAEAEHCRVTDLVQSQQSPLNLHGVNLATGNIHQRGQASFQV